MKFRHIFLGIGSLLTVIVLFLSDPDSGLIFNMPFGASTLTILIVLASSILYIGLLHLGRKALIDYVDMSEFFRNALRTPEGSGMALIAIGLLMVSVAIVILAATT